MKCCGILIKPDRFIIYTAQGYAIVQAGYCNNRKCQKLIVEIEYVSLFGRTKTERLTAKRALRFLQEHKINLVETPRHKETHPQYDSCFYGVNEEKTDPKTGEAYIQQGSHYYNTGNYYWRKKEGSDRREPDKWRSEPLTEQICAESLERNLRELSGRRN